MLGRRVGVALASLQIKAASALYPAGALHWSAIQFRAPPSSLIVQLKSNEPERLAASANRIGADVSWNSSTPPDRAPHKWHVKNVPRRDGANNSATPFPDSVASISLRLTHVSSASVKESRPKIGFNADAALRGRTRHAYIFQNRVCRGPGRCRRWKRIWDIQRLVCDDRSAARWKTGRLCCQ